VLARLWRRVETEPDTAPKPLPQIDVSYPGPQVLPATAVSDRCPKRGQNRVRVCRLYPKPPSQPLIHARALLALVREECPQYVGGYIPRPDLEGVLP
jgi:hypothetical protein